MKLRKNAIDLTDLAIGILILGITVAIGANVLLNVRDNTLTGLPLVTTTNESVDISATGTDTFANTWVSSTSATCYNATSNGALVIDSGNYTIAVDSVTGTGTISNITVDTGFDYPWNCTYTTYDTTQSDWALPNDAASGIAEFGNWFDIIVIVGIAGIILSLIFMAFGRRDGADSSMSY